MTNPTERPEERDVLSEIEKRWFDPLTTTPNVLGAAQRDIRTLLDMVKARDADQPTDLELSMTKALRVAHNKVTELESTIREREERIAEVETEVRWLYKRRHACEKRVERLQRYRQELRRLYRGNEVAYKTDANARIKQMEEALREAIEEIRHSRWEDDPGHHKRLGLANRLAQALPHDPEGAVLDADPSNTSEEGR
jgi:hypothetical protein